MAMLVYQRVTQPTELFFSHGGNHETKPENRQVATQLPTQTVVMADAEAATRGEMKRDLGFETKQRWLRIGKLHGFMGGS